MLHENMQCCLHIKHCSEVGSKQKLPHADLPGYSRSAYERDHALITPESRVWANQPGW